MVYLAVLLVLLTAFASLAVDFGRVQSAKGQLLGAADAAAVSFITSGITAAQNSAVSVASSNRTDGVSVTVDPNNDVEFGTWDSSARTFTVLTGASRSSANSVRVWCRRTAAGGNPISLSFAGILGFPAIDVRSSAIATAAVNGGGVVGLNSVSFTGAAYTDSYDSSVSAYSPGGAGTNGRVSSNGDITLTGSSFIRGDAHPGTNNNVNLAGTSYVTGNKTRLPAALSYTAPTLPSSGYTEGGTLSLSGVATASLSAGAYHYSSVSLSNSSVLNINGAVTIYVDGAIDIGGASTVNVYQSRPGNFRIQVLGSSAVMIQNGSNVAGNIYAPLRCP